MRVKTFNVEEKGALVDQVILELGFLFRTEFFQNILGRSISIILYVCMMTS